MRSGLNTLLSWMAALPHPQSDQLIALSDGELPKGKEAIVRAHMEHCARCRQRLEKILDGLKFIGEQSNTAAPAFSIDAGLDRLAIALKERGLSAERRQLPQRQTQVSEVLRTRLLSELSMYVGRGTATQLLEKCNHSLERRDRVPVVVGPVVKTFLGEEAGGALVDNLLRIWDRTNQVASEGLAP